MKCKKARTVTRYQNVTPPTVVSEAKAHVQGCPKCHDVLLLDRLTTAIIKAASAPNYEDTCNITSAVLINRIKYRIQEVREQHSSSWEMAMESMRGWLAAFAAVAVILIAASLQWEPSVTTSDFDHDSDELITQNPVEYLVSDIPDPAGLNPVSKDQPHARK